MSDLMERPASTEDSGDVGVPVTRALVNRGPGVVLIEEIDTSTNPVHQGATVRVKINVLDLAAPHVMIDPNPGLGKPFDINLGQINNPAGHAVKIAVELLDPRFEFLTNEFAITAGDEDSAGVLRRGPPPTATRLEFYVIRDPGVPAVSFNLGARTRSFGLEFYVDPKIENNG